MKSLSMYLSEPRGNVVSQTPEKLKDGFVIHELVDFILSPEQFDQWQIQEQNRLDSLKNPPPPPKIPQEAVDAQQELVDAIVACKK